MCFSNGFFDSVSIDCFNDTFEIGSKGSTTDKESINVFTSDELFTVFGIN